MFTIDLLNRAIGVGDCCPWGAAAGRQIHAPIEADASHGQPLYTPEQRRRRDESHWTTVQGVLAPIQFAVFLISLSLVLRYMATGNGLTIATASIVVKTLMLYTIMITGSIWERDVFGRYLFAPLFFWEDVVSMLVLALHTTYLISLFSGAVDPERQMWLALAAYSTYIVNAAQFVLKLRAARRAEPVWPTGGLVGHTS
jgi:3-vinyl bacteriochlorophyllide hydratase